MYRRLPMDMDIPHPQQILVAMHKTPGDKNFYSRWRALGTIHLNERLTRLDKITVLVICHRTKFDWKKLDHMPSLGYVCAPNTGVEWVPKLPPGVSLIHLPMGCTMNHVTAVPQLALKMLLDLARPKDKIGINLEGKKIAIWGYGRIGKTFGNYASALGCTILPIDIGCSKTRRNEYLKQANFVSLHLPLNNSTRGIIYGSVLDRMKRGAYIINTARADIINEPDLVSAIRSGQIAGAALDVCNSEVLPRLPSVLIYPHIGGYTIEDRIKTDELLLKLVSKAVMSKLTL